MSAECPFCPYRDQNEDNAYRKALGQALRGRKWSFYQQSNQVWCENGPSGDIVLNYQYKCAKPGCKVTTEVNQVFYHRQEQAGDWRYDLSRGSETKNIVGECKENQPDERRNKLLEQARDINSPFKLRRVLAEKAIKELRDDFGIEL